MNIPKNKAAFKRLPPGTKLVLVDNSVHKGLGRRTVLGFVDHGKTMTLRTEEGHTAFLPLTGEYFVTEKTFGFKEGGVLAAEYKFETEGESHDTEKAN